MCIRDRNEDVFVASFIGYKPKEFVADADDALTLQLEEEILAVSEVVVVGYGSESSGKPVGYEAARPVLGWQNYKDSIEKKLRYPESGSAKKVIVRLQLTISSTGDISHVKVLDSPSDDFTNEAIFQVKNGPAWLNASNNGRAVEDKVKLRLRFLPK
jgi:hypothetical protein